VTDLKRHAVHRAQRAVELHQTLNLEHGAPLREARIVDPAAW
jgi:hypothetical protein